MHIGNAEGTSLPAMFIQRGEGITAEMASQITQWDSRALIGAQINGYFMNEHLQSVLAHVNT